MNVRRLALSFLEEYESLGKYINLSLTSHRADKLSPEERAFLTSLLYTSVENKLTYDYYISAISGRGSDKIDVTTKNILRLGLCQLLDMDSVPSFAAVNETVKLARNPGERSFVNGILRAAERQKDGLPLPDKEKNYARYLSVKHSFPLWIVKRFISVYGNEETKKLLNAYRRIAPTDLTVNTEKISVLDFYTKLKENGYNVSLPEISPMTVRIEGSTAPTLLPGFFDGEFFVQDAACAASVAALSPKENENVIDVCAAPGGKSFAAAIRMRDLGRVTSFDIHESKISLILSGAERLSLKSVNGFARDALLPDENLFSTADRVICDVPCSGLGVLRKKPDLRYRSEEGLSELPELQYSILSASAKYLKAGGRMVYSTCTLLPEENGCVVDRFLAENKNFKAVDFSVGKFRSEKGRFTFLPHVHNTDGFFVCLLEKDRL